MIVETIKKMSSFKDPDILLFTILVCVTIKLTTFWQSDAILLSHLPLH